MTLTLNTAPMVSGHSFDPPTGAQFGEPFSISLNLSSTSTSNLSRVEWLINGRIVYSVLSVSGLEAQVVLFIPDFTEDGMYQARVFNENGDNVLWSMFISGSGD